MKCRGCGFENDDATEVCGNCNIGLEPVDTCASQTCTDDTALRGRRYDMSGNIHEWTADWYGEYGADAQVNPTGPATGERRASRGGGAISRENFMRVSARSGETPNGTTIGFRLARDSKQREK